MYDSRMNTAMNDKPMMHTYTIEAVNNLSDAVGKRLTSLSLDYTEIRGTSHSMFVVNQHSEQEREAVRSLGRHIAAYEQEQYAKIAAIQSVEEAKQLRRANLIRMFTFRKPLEASVKPLYSVPDTDTAPVPIQAPQRPATAPTVR